MATAASGASPSVQAGRVGRFPDVDALSSAAAQRFVDIACRALAARGQFTVALSGGSTPRKLFEKLASPPLRDAVDWSRVHFFWGDERAVSPEHPDSNFCMANEALLSKLSAVPTQQIHRMEAERSDLAAAASEYERELSRVLAATGANSATSPPPLDLVLLGMGPDAHTASLFPETEALAPTDRFAVANFVPKLDAWRLTLTPHFINSARHIIFVVAGGDKAEALRAVLREPSAGLPAQLIRPTQGSLEWLIDEASAELLGDEVGDPIADGQRKDEAP